MMKIKFMSRLHFAVVILRFNHDTFLYYINSVTLIEENEKHFN